MSEPSSLRLLMLSVGGLLGQNVLDCLEGRREGVRLVGANSEAGNPRNFRCDAAYLTPSTAEPDRFQERLLDIIEAEGPDLVIPGRDEDLAALCRLWDLRPDLRPILPCGPSSALEVIRDKWESFCFAKDRGLRFAESALGGRSDVRADLEDLVARHGFPLLAKPRGGWGSSDVYIVRTPDQLRRLLDEGDFLVQEYLDPLPDLETWARRLEFGLPLGFSLPEPRIYAAQTLITPGGEVTRFCCTVNRMVLGRPEWTAPVVPPALEALAQAYAEAVAGMGWVGPFNLQCKQLPDGSFAAFEMNGRFTASTSSRLRFGHDELGALVHHFVGPGRLPNWEGPLDLDRWIVKTLTEEVVLRTEVEDLERSGRWERG